MEKRITGLPDFVQGIIDIDSTMIRNGASKNEVLLFRGHSSKEYELIPSIGRNQRSAFDITMLGEERNLIEMAKYQLPGIFHGNLQPIDLLALLQHHGIPTRLLDITESPLVALYFACCGEDNKDKEGEVIIFKDNEKDITNYPVINAIAESYKYARGTDYPLSLFYGAVIQQPYFLEQKQMNEICNKTEEAGGEWIAECCKGPIFVYSTMMSQRQQMQQGRYILFPNRIMTSELNNKKYFEKIIDPIEKDSESIAARFIIPKEIKRQLLYDLNLMGINKERLFCDNIDIVCEGIVKSCKQRIRQR